MITMRNYFYFIHCVIIVTESLTLIFNYLINIITIYMFSRTRTCCAF